MCAYWFSNGLMSFLLFCKFKFGHFVAIGIKKTAKPDILSGCFQIFQLGTEVVM